MHTRVIESIWRRHILRLQSIYPGGQMTAQITIRGARLHNLKNVTLTIPKNQLVVLTGVSGSGKSTLGFDILHFDPSNAEWEGESSGDDDASAAGETFPCPHCSAPVPVMSMAHF